MGFLEIDSSGMARITDALRATLGMTSGALNLVVTLGAQEARKFAGPKTPISDAWMWSNGGIVKRPGGKLKAAVEGGAGSIWKLDSSAHEFHFGVDQGVPYAPSIISDDNQHRGGPYVIRAKNKPRLAFPINATTMVFPLQVTHPGGIALTGEGTGKALLHRAGDLVESRAQQIVEAAAKKLPLFK